MISSDTCMILVLFITQFCLGTSGETAGSKPNILFILQDDGGYNGLGYMNERLYPGRPKLHTPNIDALAADAVKFTSFYVLPLCSPTRSAFLTGRYPIRLGTHATNPDWGKPWGVDTAEIFIGQNLQAAGYKTALYGKWHVGCHTNASLPNARGFDEYEGFLTGGLTHFTHSTAVYSYPPSAGFPNGCNKCVKGFDWHRQRGGVLQLALDTNNTYSSLAIRDAAVDFIDRHAPDTAKVRQPWFLYAAFQTVHEPLEVPAAYRAPYNDSTKPSYIPCRHTHSTAINPTNNSRKIPGKSCDLQTYCAMATALDAAVGDIVDALERTGVLDDTVIFFASDNGAMANTMVTGGMRANGPLRGGKTLASEGGTRVPAFVYYPKALRPRWTNVVAHITDLLPTFVRGVAGGVTEKNLDGDNLWPMLVDPTGATPSPRTQMLYNLNPRPDNHDQLHCPKVGFGIMTPGGDWLKLTANFWQNITDAATDISVSVSLFNLTSDIGESRDISSEPGNRAFIDTMLDRLRDLHAQSVPPYTPWAPWQGDGYRCCNCSESWGVVRNGVRTWEPWLPDIPPHQSAGGGCSAPFPPCRVPACYGH